MSDRTWRGVLLCLLGIVLIVLCYQHWAPITDHDTADFVGLLGIVSGVAGGWKLVCDD